MIQNDIEKRKQYELLKRYIQKLTVENQNEEKLIDSFEQARKSLNEIFAYQLNQAIRCREG